MLWIKNSTSILIFIEFWQYLRNNVFLTDFTCQTFEFLKSFNKVSFRVRNWTWILIFIEFGQYLRYNGFLTDFTGQIFDLLKTLYIFLFSVKNSTSILIFIKIGQYLRNNGFYLSKIGNSKISSQSLVQSQKLNRNINLHWIRTIFEK